MMSLISPIFHLPSNCLVSEIWALDNFLRGGTLKDMSFESFPKLEQPQEEKESKPSSLVESAKAMEAKLEKKEEAEKAKEEIGKMREWAEKKLEGQELEKERQKVFEKLQELGNDKEFLNWYKEKVGPTDYEQNFVGLPIKDLVVIGNYRGMGTSAEDEMLKVYSLKLAPEGEFRLETRVLRGRSVPTSRRYGKVGATVDIQGAKSPKDELNAIKKSGMGFEKHIDFDKAELRSLNQTELKELLKEFPISSEELEKSLQELPKVAAIAAKARVSEKYSGAGSLEEFSESVGYAPMEMTMKDRSLEMGTKIASRSSRPNAMASASNYKPVAERKKK